MCTGAEIGLLGVGMSGLGALGGANAAKSSAQMTKIQLGFQADMAKINEQLNETNAQATLLTGERQEQNVRLKTSQLKHTQRASMAANGIDLGSDTAAQILTTTDLMGEIDAQQVKTNAVRSAWGYRTQGTNAANEAAMKRASANGIDPGSAFSSSLLGNAGQVAMNWYTASKGTGLSTTKGP